MDWKSHEIDALTGLPNRAGVQQLTWEGFEGWRALAFLDLDGIKEVNDRDGIGRGDSVLRGCAELLRSSLPADAVIARFGSDEFVVLHPLGPAFLADLLRPLIERMRRHQGTSITFSAGVVAVRPDDDLRDVVAAADRASYQAKAEGAARVVIYTEDTQRFADERQHLFTRLSKMHEMIRRLREEAYTDELTSLGNRRAMSRRMREVDDAVDDGPAAALFLDVDRFGDFNHRHGDAAGDEVLGVVAETLALTVRQHDVFRKGGEEFVTFLPGVSLEDAAAIGERLRAAVEDLAIPHRAPGQPVVTITVGVAMTDEATTVEQALALAADRALWLKAHGRRNSVLAAGPPPPADRSPDEDPPEGDAA
ncbi:MAG: diguanylate cyclase [Actinobacteria bacterium]|nr:diguanylate cyclase [Actinomycetota bacterium]